MKLLLILPLALMGCASSQSVDTKTLGQLEFIGCYSRDANACYKKADQICPSGYNVVSETKNWAVRHSVAVRCK